MSEHNDETHPVPVQGPAPAPAKAGWKQRAYGVRSVAAVAVAGLIIGGGAGAAIHAATADEGGRHGGPGRMGFNGGPGGFGGPGGQMQGGPGGGQRQPQPPNGLPAPPDGLPGQTPPGVAPDDSVDPDAGGDTRRRQHLTFATFVR